MVERYPDGTGTGTWFPDEHVTVSFDYRVGPGGVAVTGYHVSRTDGEQITRETQLRVANGLDEAAVQTFARDAAKMFGDRKELGDGTLMIGDAKVEARDVVITGYSAELARSIADDARRRGRRRAMTPERLAEVAAVYAANAEAPTKAVEREMHVSRPQAARLVRAAREAGLIPPRAMTTDKE